MSAQRYVSWKRRLALQPGGQSKSSAVALTHRLRAALKQRCPEPAASEH